MPIPKDLLGPDGALAQAEDPLIYLNEMTAKSKTIKHVSPMSIIVAIKDARYIVIYI